MSIRVKILIVEDDVTTQERLAAVLSQFGYEVVGYSDSVAEALSMIQSRKPDLLLLDVHLGQEKATGIDLAREVRKFSDMPIIFLSVYQRQDYVQHAQFLGAHSYMTKPFREFDLRTAIDFAIQDYAQRGTPLNEPPVPKRDLFVLTADQAYQKVLVRDIAYVQAQGSSVDIYTLDGRKFTQSCNLKSFERQSNPTEPHLIRIHRSYLVNEAAIESLSRSYQLTLSNGEGLPVGKQFHASIKALLNIIWAD